MSVVSRGRSGDSRGTIGGPCPIIVRAFTRQHRSAKRRGPCEKASPSRRSRRSSCSESPSPAAAARYPRKSSDGVIARTSAVVGRWAAAEAEAAVGGAPDETGDCAPARGPPPGGDGDVDGDGSRR